MTDKRKGGMKLTAEEVNRFLHDNSLPTNSSIITSWPFESFLCIRWDKLKELLECHAGIRFSTKPMGKKGKVNIVLPIKPIMNETHPCQRDKWDKRVFAVPCCRTATKGRLPVGTDVRDLTFYMHKRMENNVRVIQHINTVLSEIQFSPALNIRLEGILQPDTPIAMTITGQRGGITAYQDGSGEEYQYFNSLLSVRRGDKGIRLYKEQG